MEFLEFIFSLCRRGNLGPEWGSGLPKVTQLGCLTLGLAPVCPESVLLPIRQSSLSLLGSEISIQNLLEVCNLKVKFCHLRVKKKLFKHERIQDSGYQKVLGPAGASLALDSKRIFCLTFRGVSTPYFLRAELTPNPTAVRMN